MTDLYRFIEKELALRKKHYRDDPVDIIEHFNIERGAIQTYNGRQLLEMLQNADDAAETALSKKVLIRLTQTNLIIANNGEPFSKEGFRSITRSSISPKIKQQNKIGQKGFGFRSILSWADEIEIRSGGANIGFSEKIAHAFLKNLIEEEPSISDILKEISDYEFPIAILRVPLILDVSDDMLNEYDTIISLTLKENIFDDVQSQIQTIITRETLVFLNNLEEVRIESPERKVVIRKAVKGNKVEIKYDDLLNNTSDTAFWYINKIRGEHIYVENQKKRSKNYELAIAWNEELTDKENYLFSYFKTMVRFPFPALLHGTFELSQNRNQLENDTLGHNKFLIEKLAELLVDTALKIAAENTIATYSPLRLLNINFNEVDPLLNTFQLKEKLVNKIKESKIFPTVNGNYISASEHPIYYDFPIAKFLKGEDVSNLLLHDGDEQFITFLKSVEHRYYLLWYFIKIISVRTDNLDHLAKLIYHALTYNDYVNAWTSDEFKLSEQPEFLIDNNGNPIKWSSQIFIQPQSDRIFNLPESLRIQFLEPDLVKLLLKEFKINDVNILLSKLEPFHIKKYSFLEIAEALIKHYSDRKKIGLSEIKELHSYLFQLFKIEYTNKSLEPISADIFTPVISKLKKKKAASEVYFGEHYGHALTEQLYGFNKSNILAEKGVFGLKNEDERTVKEYFIWLRVAELPRYSLKSIIVSKTDSYLEYILKNFKYPLEKWNHTFESYHDVLYWFYWGATLQVGEFDNMEKILTHSKLEYVFGWINKDKRLRDTLENDREILTDSQISFSWRGHRRVIEKREMLSYTKWKISAMNILPVEASISKSAPIKCCLSKTITNEFSPYVEIPKVPISIISEKLQLSENVIENYLTLLGVHREISSFPMDVLYNMLASLEKSAKERKVAKSIYREVVSNYDQNKIDESDYIYKKFIDEGKVLCQKGTTFGYYPIKEAYYIDTKTFSNNILQRFALVCIDKKSGPDKVKKIFGVNPLDNISFKIIGNPQIHPLNNHFVNEINRFKALVYTLRLPKDTKFIIRNQLKRLKITLTNDIKAEFIFKDTSEKFEVEQYDFIVTKNKSQFHILVPETETSLSGLKQNYLFCNSIAEIFTSRINTEDYRDFIHHLYSLREIDREPAVLNYLHQETPEILNSARKTLDIIDDIRISFWSAFSIASAKKVKTDIRNEKELNIFLQKTLRLDIASMDKVSTVETFTQLSELSNQEFIYQLFLKYKVDFIKFSRHFSGLDFTELFKNELEDIKRRYLNDFTSQLYKNIKTQSIGQKKDFFNILDDYNNLIYTTEEGFLSNIEQYFKNKVNELFSIRIENQKNNFSYTRLLNDTIISLSDDGISIPPPLLEDRNIQALLLFAETEEIQREIEKFNTSSTTKTSNQIRIRNATIEYEDFQSLAQKVLEGFDFSKFAIKTSRTLSVEEKVTESKTRKRRSKSRKVRFNTKNEEQVGFVAELLSYHKLCDKYGESNINWISENAFRAYPEKFPSGEAGKGYDLELIEESGKVRYVEIKGIETIRDGIHMTNKEMKIALEFPDKYDLMIVENPLDDHPNFRYVRNQFKFRSDETLLSNKKLKVDFDNYLIKFKWDD